MNSLVSYFPFPISQNSTIVQNYQQSFNYAVFYLQGKVINSRTNLLIERIETLEKKLEQRIDEKIIVQIPNLNSLSNKIEFLQKQVDHLNNNTSTTLTTNHKPWPQLIQQSNTKLLTKNNIKEFCNFKKIAVSSYAQALAGNIKANNSSP